MEFFKQTLIVARGVTPAQVELLETRIEEQGGDAVWIEKVNSHSIEVLVHGGYQGLAKEWHELFRVWINDAKFQVKHVDSVANNSARYMLTASGVSQYANHNANLANKLF